MASGLLTDWLGLTVLILMAVLLVLVVILLMQMQAWRSRVNERLAVIEHGQRTGLEVQDRALRTVTERNEQSLMQSRQELSQGMNQLQTSIQSQFEHLRGLMDTQLRRLQADNTQQLEAMRQTVDEKLHVTLEQRLGASFQQVSERLEQVYRGLGEMQSLATGVGDLKRVLTNVKVRGTWGEVQLESLLTQMLTPDQYGKNIRPVPGKTAVVEFAVRLPGRAQQGDEPVWLPIDAKFPKEQYEKLLDAFDAADADAVAQCSKALELAIKVEAKSISEKYISPPHTTDFAILFLPTEGLYAEIVKRPGLVDMIQREYRVTLAGPVNLTTLLNALQMGFKTLALEKRSSEVWQVLGAVKTEFAKFGTVLAKTRESLERAARNIETAEVRSRAVQRKLRSVESIADSEAQAFFPAELDWDEPMRESDQPGQLDQLDPRNQLEDEST